MPGLTSLLPDPSKKDPVPEVLGVAAGIALGAGSVLLYNKCIEYFSRLPQYSHEELVRYNKLVKHYQKYIKNEIPKEWVLKDGRPTHNINYKLESSVLIDKISCLTIPESNISEASRGMLNVIAKLFGSFDHRIFGAMKGSSIEGFFFTELASLVYTRFPQMRFDVAEDLEELKNILEYCNCVFKDVIRVDFKALNVFPILHPRNNPLHALTEVTANLKGVIAASIELNHEETFVSYIDQLDNALSSMAAETFHILYLLTNGDQRNQPNLPVVSFLDDNQTHLPSLTNYKNDKLRLWIKETLIAAGITCNDFKNTKTPSLASTDRHLEGESILDLDCYLSEKLLNPKDASWGHWAFSISSQVPVDEVKQRIETTRRIHQDILKLYNQCRSLKNSRMIAPVSGESWLYGDETGLAMVSALMDSTKIIADRLDQSLGSLMKKYTDIFFDAKRHNKIKGESCEEKAVTMALHHYSQGAKSKEFGFKEHYEKAKKTILAINTHCEGYQSRRVNTDHSKRLLLQDLIEHRRYFKKTEDKIYQQLQTALYTQPSEAELTAHIASEEAKAAEKSARLSLKYATEAAEAAKKEASTAAEVAKAADIAAMELELCRTALLKAKTTLESLKSSIDELKKAKVLEQQTKASLILAKAEERKCTTARFKVRGHKEERLLVLSKLCDSKDKMSQGLSEKEKAEQLALAQKKIALASAICSTKETEAQRAIEALLKEQTAYNAALEKRTFAEKIAEVATKALPAANEAYSAAQTAEAVAAALLAPLNVEKQEMTEKSALATKKACILEDAATAKEAIASIAAKKAKIAAEKAKEAAADSAKLMELSKATVAKKIRLDSLPCFQLAKDLFKEGSTRYKDFYTPKADSFSDVFRRFSYCHEGFFPLPKEPKAYSSTLHENIYKHFLVSNYWYISATVICNFWEPANDEKFRELYKKVNLIMHFLYQDGNPRSISKRLTAEEQDLDKLLIDQILEALMAEYCTKYCQEPHFSECRRPNTMAALSHVDNKDGTITIKLNSRLIPYAESSVSEAYEALKVEHLLVIAERDAAVVKIKHQAELIACQAEKIDGLTETIVDQSKRIASLSETVVVQSEMIAGQSETISGQDKVIVSKEGELAKLQAKQVDFKKSLDQADVVVAERDTKIERLQQELEVANRQKSEQFGSSSRIALGSSDMGLFATKNSTTQAQTVSLSGCLHRELP